MKLFTHLKPAASITLSLIVFFSGIHTGNMLSDCSACEPVPQSIFHSEAIVEPSYLAYWEIKASAAKLWRRTYRLPSRSLISMILLSTFMMPPAVLPQETPVTAEGEHSVWQIHYDDWLLKYFDGWRKKQRDPSNAPTAVESLLRLANRSIRRTVIFDPERNAYREVGLDTMFMDRNVEVNLIAYDDPKEILLDIANTNDPRFQRTRDIVTQVIDNTEQRNRPNSMMDPRSLVESYRSHNSLADPLATLTNSSVSNGPTAADLGGAVRIFKDPDTGKIYFYIYFPRKTFEDAAKQKNEADIDTRWIHEFAHAFLFYQSLRIRKTEVELDPAKNEMDAYALELDVLKALVENFSFQSHPQAVKDLKTKIIAQQQKMLDLWTGRYRQELADQSKSKKDKTLATNSEMTSIPKLIPQSFTNKPKKRAARLQIAA